MHDNEGGSSFSNMRCSRTHFGSCGVYVCLSGAFVLNLPTPLCCHTPGMGRCPYCVTYVVLCLRPHSLIAAAAQRASRLISLCMCLSEKKRPVVLCLSPFPSRLTSCYPPPYMCACALSVCAGAHAFVHACVWVLRVHACVPARMRRKDRGWQEWLPANR